MTLLDLISTNWMVQLALCLVAGGLIALAMIIRATRESTKLQEAAKPAEFTRKMEELKVMNAWREKELQLKLTAQNSAVATISNNRME